MQFDLIIVGGGLAGSSLAVALRGSGRRIALVEGRAPVRPAGWDNRVYAISPGSLGFLAHLGILDRLEAARIAPIHDMRIAGDGGGSLHFSAYECGVDRLASIAEASLIGQELWETARRQAQLTLFCPAQPSGLRVDAEKVGLQLADGRTLEAPLLAAADGADSWVRQQAGLDSTVSPYDELGVVANFACEREHCGTAWQWFRDDGVLAWLPLPERRMSMVWSAPLELGQELLALPPRALAERVAAAGDYTLGELEVLTPAAGFPLRLLTVPQITAPRIALLGDAAHGIHPLSGHGINLGFSDARALADLILATPAVADLGEPLLLRRYQRQRKEETLFLQHGTHALHTLFAQRSPGLAWLRNFGLDLTDRLGPVKSFFARYAMG